MTKSILVAVLALSSVACAAGGGGHDESYDLGPAPEHTDVEERALARWEEATGLRSLLEHILITYQPLENISCPPGAHACYHVSANHIFMRDDRAEDHEQWLVHEYGHALLGRYGYDRDGERGHPEVGEAHHAIPGIMAAWWEPLGITRELLEVVCSARPCTRFAPEN